MTRKEARNRAFELIFEKEISGSDIDDIIAYAEECRDFSTDEDGYILNAFRTTFDNIEKIDGMISQNLSGWTIDRISKVSLAVLRLAVCEIMFMDDIPDAVSIDEAVELCKTYSTADDAAFVNGVLGTVVRGKNN